MRNYFISGILDNDAKGELKGTLFYADVFLNNTLERYIWNIFDQINNTPFYKEVISLKKRVEEEAIQLRVLQEEKDKLQKQDRLASDISSVTITPQIADSITFICNSELKLATLSKEGNEKSLNALVGKLIKHLKNENHSDVKPIALKHFLIEYLK